MSEWKRTTREVPFERLPSEVISAINKHIAQYNLGPILGETVMCIQTDSEKIRKSLFGGQEIVHTGAVVTPGWLVQVVYGAKTHTAVLSAQLKDVVVQDYSQAQFAKMIPDSGIEVTGRFTDASENGSVFIGLDESAVGMKFKEMVINFAQDAKK